MESSLTHKVNYIKSLKICSVLAVIFLGITIFAAIPLLFITLSKNTLGIVVVALILGLSFFLPLCIAYLVIYSRTKKTGLFEALDIVDNKIIYVSEKSGERVFAPDGIESMSFTRYSKYNSDQYYYVHIKCIYDPAPFKVPSGVSKYADLVGKLRKFKEDNQIK